MKVTKTIVAANSTVSRAKSQYDCWSASADGYILYFTLCYFRIAIRHTVAIRTANDRGLSSLSESRAGSFGF